MRVNRVFCYSKDVAKQNGNKLPILQIVLCLIIFMIVIFVMAFLLVHNSLLFMIITFTFIGVTIYYSVILGIRLRTRMSGWATTEDGRIFKAMAINNGQGLFLGGIATGSLVDQLTNNSNNLGESLGGTVGAAAEFYSMNKSAQYMNHPEIIAKMVEEAPNISGAEVIELLKVYSITEKKHVIKINCDYKILRTDVVMYNKNMSIEKSYNQMNDLVNLINTHK